MPSTGRQLRSFSQEIVLIHQGSEGRSLSHLAIILIFLPGETFLLLALERMRDVGSVWFVYSTTLPEPGKGETGDLGYVTKRLVLVFYTLFPTHILLGGGARWEMENGWKKVGACWEIRVIPGVGSMGLCWGRQERHTPGKNMIPHDRERSVKVRPPHCTPGGRLCLRSVAREGGRQCRSAE